jgi:hypothetical protein
MQQAKNPNQTHNNKNKSTITKLQISYLGFY